MQKTPLKLVLASSIVLALAPAAWAQFGAPRGQYVVPPPIPPSQIPSSPQAQPAPPRTTQPVTPPPAQAPAAPLASPPASEKIANPVAVFEGLDKITGRIISFDVYIDETVQFGALQVTPRVCYTRPATEEPQTDAFVEVDEITLTRQVQRIFTGWMFASNPGLHAVDHPVYDVWLTNCKMSSPVPPPVKR